MMRSSDTSSRAVSIAATATTLVAILAMASTSSFATAVGSIPLQARSLPAESPVRTMAAVVAAVARDLMDRDVVVAAAVAVGPGVLPEDGSRAAAAPRSTHATGPRRLGARLLDLPPPIR